MIAAADTTVFAAFFVGFVSFVSPCVLPLVPGYLSAVSGVGVGEVKEGAGWRVVGPAALFCLSFTVVFMALGMTATGLGQTLNDNRRTLEIISGSIVIAMGLFFLLTPFVTALNRDFHPQALMARAGAGGPFVAGAAFAVAWTPCIGPTLSAVLAAAATSDNVAGGAILLFCYSAGLAVPFLLSAVLFHRATNAFAWLRDHHTVITAIGGAILVVFGFLILTGELARLNAEAQRLLGDIGLDWIYTL